MRLPHLILPDYTESLYLMYLLAGAISRNLDGGRGLSIGLFGGKCAYRRPPAHSARFWLTARRALCYIADNALRHEVARRAVEDAFLRQLLSND